METSWKVFRSFGGQRVEKCQVKDEAVSKLFGLEPFDLAKMQGATLQILKGNAQQPFPAANPEASCFIGLPMRVACS